MDKTKDKHDVVPSVSKDDLMSMSEAIGKFHDMDNNKKKKKELSFENQFAKQYFGDPIMNMAFNKLIEGQGQNIQQIENMIKNHYKEGNDAKLKTVFLLNGYLSYVEDQKKKEVDKHKEKNPNADVDELVSDSESDDDFVMEEEDVEEIPHELNEETMSQPVSPDDNVYSKLNEDLQKEYLEAIDKEAKKSKAQKISELLKNAVTFKDKEGKSVDAENLDEATKKIIHEKITNIIMDAVEIEKQPESHNISDKDEKFFEEDDDKVSYGSDSDIDPNIDEELYKSLKDQMEKKKMVEKALKQEMKEIDAFEEKLEKKEIKKKEPKKMSLYEEMLIAQQKMEYKASPMEIEAGFGSFMLPDSSTYTGQVNSNGVPHGQGVQEMEGIVIYDGQYVNGLKQGFGTFYFSNGGKAAAKYVGQFNEESFHGSGQYWAITRIKKSESKNVIISDDGMKLIFDGTFDKGNPTDGTLYIQRGHGYAMSNAPNYKYIGTVVQGDHYGGMQFQAIGDGKLYDENDNLVEEGNFVNGKLNGHGKRYIDGYPYEGLFQNGDMTGNFKFVDDEFEYVFYFRHGQQAGLIDQVEIKKTPEQLAREKMEKEKFILEKFKFEI